MHFLLKRIDELGTGWNERQLTDVDFYRLCNRFNIGVQEMPLSVCGFYYRVMGRDFIAIDSKLRGPERLAVMFHELGHSLFHTPETGPTANFHGVGHRTRKECEADVFALCAVLPRSAIENRRPQELIDDEGLSFAIVTARYQIFERFGL